MKKAAKKGGGRIQKKNSHAYNALPALCKIRKETVFVQNLFGQKLLLVSLTEIKSSNIELATITTDIALKGLKVLTIAEERKGYWKRKDSARKIDRKGYQSEVVIAMENQGTTGDELLVRSLVSTITINCTCKNRRSSTAGENCRKGVKLFNV